MATSYETLAALCLRFEGVRLRPYRCPAGVPTIGIGSTRYEDGRAVTMADPPITRERADAMAERDQRAYLTAACKMSPILRSLANAQRRAAIADFIYNLGPTRYAASTLRRKVDAGDWPAAKRELARWVYGGGKKLPGLVKRRAAEAALL